jgi:hypothetical protein
MPLPACGIYRTTAAIGTVPAGRLVYFHNHGAPGPGIYLPDSWHLNRARFLKQGTTLPDEATAETLDPLAPEGLYRVEAEFACCERMCQIYPRGQLVQLGYDATAQPLLFVPKWTPTGLAFPELGQRVDGPQLSKLSRLVIEESSE